MLDKHLIAKTSPKANDKNVIRWLNYRITVLTDKLFRIEEDEKRIFNDNATQTVWFRDMPPVKYKTKQIADGVCVETEAVQIVINRDYENSYVLLNGNKVGISNEGNLMGTYRTLDRMSANRDFETDEEIKMGTGVCSLTGVAVVDDTRSLVLKDNGELDVAYNQIRDEYVFAYGNDYKGAVKALFAICGNVPLIPRYALGNWWSRYHAYTDKEYLNLLDSFEERNIPFTVATIDMDWHYSNDLDKQKRITELGRNTPYYGGNDGWTGYSWNKELFPDYKKFLKEIKKRNYAITLNLHPALGVRWFEDMYEDFAKAMNIDASSGKQIEFDCADTNFINAYFSILHKPYEKDGVKFWWVDWQQGTDSKKEGLDPLWALNHYHFLDKGKNDKPLILSRYCGVGAHRYPLGFSGDTIINWETLDYIPYFTSTATNIGYTWWSHDIGGHMNGQKDGEQYLRYLQFGVFSPINRLHCSCNPMCNKEPWFYMNGIGYMAEEALRLRHSMIPYLYSADYLTHEKGQAIVEPLYYYEPHKKQAYEYKNEYIFAGQLLVSPITKHSFNGFVKQKIYFPDGKWTDIFTGETYEGGERTIVRWLDTIPVFAKEGGFFVTSRDKTFNSVQNPHSLNVEVYNGNGSFQLVEDDGNDKVFRTNFASFEQCGKQYLKITFEGVSGVIPCDRSLRLAFKNVHDGKIKVLCGKNEQTLEAIETGYTSVVIGELDFAETYIVEVEYKKEDKLSLLKRNAGYAIRRLDGDNDLRSELYEKLIACKSVDEFASIVNETTTKKEGKKSLSGIYKDKLLETL